MAAILHLLKTLELGLVYVYMKWKRFNNEVQSFLHDMSSEEANSPLEEEAKG